MGDLRDALRKANVLSKKEARRLAHEERVHRSKVGREGLQQEQDQRHHELAALREEQRQRGREAQEEQQARQQAAAEAAACRDLLRQEVVPASSPGGQPFFVQLADGTLPRLSLGPVERANLLAGALCVVRVGPGGCHDYGLLQTGHARRVRETFPDRVVWAARGVLGETGRPAPPAAKRTSEKNLGIRVSPWRPPGHCRTDARGASTPMRPSTPGLLSFLVLGSTTLLPAQTPPDHNEVMLFGSIDMVQAVKHPSTGYPLELPGVSPPAFTASSTTGVPAGTLTWVWYPSQLHARYEDHVVTGHIVATRPSSATPAAAYTQTQTGQTSPGVPQYIPRFSIYRAKARPKPTPLPAFGAGYDPDFGKQPLFRYTTSHSFLETRPDTTRVWAVTYNTGVKIPSSRQGGPNAEMVLAFEWKGGEHWKKSGSQSIPTGWSEQHFAPVHWGLASAGSPRTITYFDPTKIIPGSTFNLYSSPFGGYYEGRSSLILHSDWGELRDPTLAATVYPSYNPGSGLSDLASTAGAFNWDVYSSRNYRGRRALPLLNIRVGVQGSGTPFAPHMLEVDPTDPFLAALWSNPLVNGVISNTGVWLPTRRVRVPALGSRAIGIWIGLETGIIDNATGSVLDTTNACWFYIRK